MDGAEISVVASLMADPARARILRALIDGTMRPAGELACVANVSAQSASAHLAKLVNSGLLALEPQGRHRYFRISSAAVAEAIESLASLSVALRPIPLARVPPSKTTPVAFLYARTCYDHLAGEMAVRICRSMLEARWLTVKGRDFRVTPSGAKSLAKLGVNIEEAQRQPRAFARACIDLTQRRPHIGGALGAALLNLYVERGWVIRTRRSRVVSITPRGEDAFSNRIG